MKNTHHLTLIGLLSLFCVVQAEASGQTNASPTLYVHFGFGQGTNAVQVLCTKVHLGEPIFVSSADLRYIRPWNNWKLTGHVDQHGAEMTADLLGSSASESQFYRGKMTPEMPYFAQGGAASGGAGGPMWFIVSTNMESKPILDKLQDMDAQTRKNSP